MIRTFYGPGHTARLFAIVTSSVALPLSAQNSVIQQVWDPQQILRTETYVRPPAVVERIIMAPDFASAPARREPATRHMLTPPL